MEKTLCAYEVSAFFVGVLLTVMLAKSRCVSQNIPQEENYVESCYVVL